jgi:hypothetical protein
MLVPLRVSLVEKIHHGKLSEGGWERGTSMNQQLTERAASQTYWPRVRELPRCLACAESMVAPEASALRPDGKVSYLWSCDCCGQSLITNAAKPTNLPSLDRVRLSGARVEVQLGEPE